MLKSILLSFLALINPYSILFLLFDKFIGKIYKSKEVFLHYLWKLPRINPDEILQEFGNWRKPSDMLTAGKIAIERISTYLENGTSFSQGTTLCGHSILRNINSAKQKGYSIELHYIGIESPELAKQRVRLRVQKGGHGIPEKYIERRYFDSLNNLKKNFRYMRLGCIL